MATVHATLSELADAGFMLPERLRPAPVWRAHSFGKLHTRRGCVRFRSSVRRFPSDVAGADRDDWCSACAGLRPDGELGEWMTFAYKVLLAERALVVAADEPRLAELTGLHAAVRAVRRVRSCDHDVAARRDELLRRAGELLGSRLTSSEGRLRATRAAAVRVLARRGSAVPDGTPHDLLAPARGRNMVRRHAGPLVDAWARFMATLRSESRLDTACAAARDAAVAVLDDAFDAHRLPSRARLDGTSFAHPLDWARAEWRLVALDELDRCIDHWCDLVDAAAGAQVVAVIRWPREEPRRQQLLSPFPAEFDTGGHYLLACVPAVVLDAFAGAAPTGRGKEHHVLSEGAASVEELQVAAPLVFEGGTGPPPGRVRRRPARLLTVTLQGSALARRRRPLTVRGPEPKGDRWPPPPPCAA